MLVSSLANLLVGEIANLLKLTDMKQLLIRLLKGSCLDRGPRMWEPCDRQSSFQCKTDYLLHNRTEKFKQDHL